MKEIKCQNHAKLEKEKRTESRMSKEVESRMKQNLE